MKKRRYRRLFAVLTAAMFSACNVSTALAMPLQELTEDYQDFNTKLVEESRPKDIGSDAFSEHCIPGMKKIRNRLQSSWGQMPRHLWRAA